ELSDAQVHLTFLKLRAWRPPYRDAANAELMAAEIDSPEDPEVHYWHAIYEWRNGAPDKAVTLLREALDGIPHDAVEPSPREARYRLALYNCRFAGIEKSGPQPSDELLASLQPDVAELARVANSATALNNVAWYHVMRREPEAGMPFAMRATQADPTCFSCFDTLAALYALRGHFAQAVQAQERAFSLLPESARMPEIKARLDEYRQKALAP
ncbi:MAG TPA: hypothetical protein VIA18_08210, partial [Polyangia bacterium]|nr:hypothetical protein [Polyangia bacterium]